MEVDHVGRERQKQTMRSKLYACAVELFVERGYETTTYDDIADRADVSRTTVFNYFSRKEDFLVAWSATRRERVQALLQAADASETATRSLVHQAVLALAAINEEERRATLQLLPAWVRTGAPVTEQPFFATIFAQLISRGQSRAEVKPDIDAAEVGYMLRQVYLGVLFRWVATAEAEPPFVLSDTLRVQFDLLLDGVLLTTA